MDQRGEEARKRGGGKGQPARRHGMNHVLKHSARPLLVRWSAADDGLSQFVLNFGFSCSEAGARSLVSEQMEG